MRFDYMFKIIGYSRINIEHDWEGLCDCLKKKIKIKSQYLLYLLHPNSIPKPWNRNMQESQLLIIWDDFWSNQKMDRVE